VTGLSGTVTGCRAYLNRRLARLGIAVVFECTVSGSLSGVAEIRAMAEEAGRTLGDALGTKLAPLLSERELIGRSFDLYKFRLTFGVSEIGELRLVVRKNVPLNVTGVLSATSLPALGREALESLAKGEAVTVGTNLGYREAARECEQGETPVGQVAIPKFVIYSAEGEIPRIPPESWSLALEWKGSRRTLTYQELLERSKDLGAMDFHCVTGWSVKGKRYMGVTLDELLRGMGDMSEAKWVFAESATGYSTVIPIEEAHRTLIVFGIDGQRLPPENGGPARLFNPSLYGWKGAKWLAKISLEKDYIDGFWEALGYHERGLVQRNERFKIRNPDVVDLC